MLISLSETWNLVVSVLFHNLVVTYFETLRSVNVIIIPSSLIWLTKLPNIGMSMPSVLSYKVAFLKWFFKNFYLLSLQALGYKLFQLHWLYHKVPTHYWYVLWWQIDIFFSFSEVGVNISNWCMIIYDNFIFIVKGKFFSSNPVSWYCIFCNNLCSSGEKETTLVSSSSVCKWKWK